MRKPVKLCKVRSFGWFKLGTFVNTVSPVAAGEMGDQSVSTIVGGD